MNQQKRAWNIGITIGVLVIVLLTIISIKELKSIAYVGKSDQIVNTITVSGTGEQVVNPDIATFSFNVTETSKSIITAQGSTTDKIGKTLAAIRTAGIADADIKTTSYSINPHYEYQGGVCTTSYPSTCIPSKSVLTGYDVSQSIEVKVRDLTKVGAIFATIGALDVQNLSSLSFTIDDITAVQEKARLSAIQDAQSKAQELAKELGVSLVRVTSFYDSNNQAVPVAYGMANESMMKVASVPEIPAGQNKITSNVSITYEIQ